MDQVILESQKYNFKELPRAKAVALAMEIFGFLEPDAQTFVSMAKGEIRGDVINVDAATPSELERLKE